MSGFDPGGGGGGFPQTAQQPHTGGPIANIPFSQEDESNISSMARFMFIAGILEIVTAVFALIGNVIGMVRFDLPGAMMGMQGCGALFGIGAATLLGAMLMIGSKAFSKVVSTSDQDQVHLTEGLRKLRAYWMIRGIIVILVVLLICAMIPIMMVMMPQLQRQMGAPGSTTTYQPTGYQPTGY